MTSFLMLIALCLQLPTILAENAADFVSRYRLDHRALSICKSDARLSLLNDTGDSWIFDITSGTCNISSIALKSVNETSGTAYTWHGWGACGSQNVTFARLYCHRPDTVLNIDDVNRHEGRCYLDFGIPSRGERPPTICVYYSEDHGSVLLWIVASVILGTALVIGVVCIACSARQVPEPPAKFKRASDYYTI